MAIVGTKDGSTVTIMEQVDQAWIATEKAVEALGDSAEQTKTMVQALSSLFEEQRKKVRALAPQVDQLKGLAKGLELAVPMVDQHHEIWRQRFSGMEDTENLRLAHQVVNGCKVSLQEATRAQREEMVRITGRFEGEVNAAFSILRKIEALVSRASVQEDKFEGTDELDEQLSRPRDQDGGNGIAKDVAETLTAALVPGSAIDPAKPKTAKGQVKPKTAEGREKPKKTIPKKKTKSV